MEEKSEKEVQSDKRQKLYLYFLSSFAVAITNPATVLSFLAAFAVFRISGSLGLYEGSRPILGILIGTLCWWGGLGGIVLLFRQGDGQDLDMVK